VNSRPFFVLTCCLCVVALAISLYVWQLRKQSEEETPSTAAPEVVTTPANAIHKQVTLWVAQDKTGNLQSQSLSIVTSLERQREAEDILRALLSVYTAKGSPHPLATGTGVRNVFFVDPGLVVIDVTAELSDGQTSGIFAEELTVASLVQTLASNFPDISRVKFLVDGKEATTLAGHVDLSNTYGISQFSALAKQFSAQ
jgi:hypothetical protein